MYPIIKNLLFKFDPETSHYIALESLKWAHRLQLLKLFSKKIKTNPYECMGIKFPNRVGLAAGLDKNGDYIDALAALGFGFIEIGTITPKPQAGNPKPRLFRLVEQEAIINRMGFNSKGADYVVSQLEKIQYRGVLGINIGKNKDTPNENAVDDYVIGFRKFANYASYITINISSPNTAGLRDLQQHDALIQLLSTLKSEQANFLNTHKKYVPLAVKISPDLSAQELEDIAAILIEQKIDAVIATDTTIDRDLVINSPYANETGGLSGKPLQEKSSSVIKSLKTILQNKLPIIGVGGILDTASAQDKFSSGADLIQIYTGFIYYGPALINQIN